MVQWVEHTGNPEEVVGSSPSVHIYLFLSSWACGKTSAWYWTCLGSIPAADELLEIALMVERLAGRGFKSHRTQFFSRFWLQTKKWQRRCMIMKHTLLLCWLSETHGLEKWNQKICQTGTQNWRKLTNKLNRGCVPIGKRPLLQARPPQGCSRSKSGS